MVAPTLRATSPLCNTVLHNAAEGPTSRALYHRGVSTTEILPLAGGFAASDRDDWLRAVEAATGGRSIDDLSTDVGGLTVLPLYTRGDRDPVGDEGLPGLAPFARGAAAGRQGWDVRQLHHLSDPGIDRAAVADLENGATSILVQVGDADPDRLGHALAGVRLDAAPVHLEPGLHFAACADAMTRLWADRGVPLTARTGGLGIDPLGTLARSGADLEMGETVAAAAEVAAESAANHPGVVAMRVDASVHAERGAREVDELACSVATGVAYLRALTSAGVATADAFDQLEFTYSATPDQFMTIAKLRAARRVWARVAELCSVRPVGQRQHAITSAATMSSDDPWVNVVRATVACLGAGLGGAAAVTVRPADAGLDTAHAQRLARNTQLLLLEESNLGQVIDPGGGAWYVENLSAQLAEQAWEAFRGIEAAGGVAEALAAGTIGAAP